MPTIHLDTLFVMALPYLQQAGRWRVAEAFGSASTPSLRHWHATVRNNLLDVNVTARDSRRAERAGAFLLALMQDAADGVLLSIS